MAFDIKDIYNREGETRTAFFALMGVASMMFLLLVVLMGFIMPKPELTVKTNSLNVTYSGKEYSSAGYEVRGLLEGHTARVTVTGSRRDVGITLNTAEITVLDKRGKDVTAQYEIIKELGVINVLPAELTVKSASLKVSSSELSPSKLEQYDITEGYVRAGEIIFVTFLNGDYTVGEYDNAFSAKILTLGGEDVTKNYEITYEFGLLQIIPDDEHRGEISSTS